MANDKTLDDTLAGEFDPNSKPVPITFELPGADGAPAEEVTVPAPLSAKAWYLIHKNLFVKLDPNELPEGSNESMIQLLLDGIVTDPLRVISYATGIPVKRLEDMDANTRSRVETALTLQLGQEMRAISPFSGTTYTAGQEMWANLIGMMTSDGGEPSSSSKSKSAAGRGGKRRK